MPGSRSTWAIRRFNSTYVAIPDIPSRSDCSTTDGVRLRLAALRPGMIP